MAVELFPTDFARPESFRANKHHSLNTDIEGMINERPDLFERGIGHELPA